MKKQSKKNNKNILKSFFKFNKPLMILLVLFLPIILLIIFPFSSHISNNPKQNLTSYISKTSLLNDEEEHSAWPTNPTEELSLREILSNNLPTKSNLQKMSDWASKFNVDLDTPMTSQAFVSASRTNHVFDWSAVGLATTGQFKEFITFYGKDDGLKYFTSAIFEDTDIDLGLPEFWLSLKAYMPNLTEITIKCNYTNHKSMTSLPKEIGVMPLETLTIQGENIGENYANFMYTGAPITGTLKFLTIKNCNISDHDELLSDEDKLFYFTDILFENASNLKHLLKLDLSYNKLTHIKGNLIKLPKIVELILRSNKISTWHCIDVNGTEIDSGVGQYCFPNPSGINYVDLYGNNLYEIIHIEPGDWKPTTITTYKSLINSRYPNLNFVNIGGQTVEMSAFVFGSNVNFGGLTYSDMDIDLSNIFYYPENLTEDELTAWIGQCLTDRVTNKNTAKDADRWVNLTLTSNLMPSIIDLFGDKCNYFNYSLSEGIDGDYSLDNDSELTFGVHNNEVKEVKYYKEQTTSVSTDIPPDPCYFSSETSSTILQYDTTIGAKVLKLCPGEDVWKYEDFGWTSGNALTYDSIQHTIRITPHYLVNVGAGGSEYISTSSYVYNIKIFNAEDYAFYLSAINTYDENGDLIYNDYIKSISDSDITVEEAYTHFYDLVTYSGNYNKWENFKFHFDDRSFWNINFIVNNKVSRKITLSVTYYAYQYIGGKSESPSQVTYLLTIYTVPEAENKLEKILFLIFFCELGLLGIMLILLLYFLIRTKIKSKAIIEKKNELIKEKRTESAPLIKLEENLYKDKKIPFKERIKRNIESGDKSKTTKVKVEEKDIKVNRKAKSITDVDEILKDLD